MSIVEEIVRSVVDGVVGEFKRNRKRAARRKQSLTAAERLKRIERLLKPSSGQQVSRKKKTLSRSTAQKRRVASRTRKHRKSLRSGKARR